MVSCGTLNCTIPIIDDSDDLGRSSVKARKTILVLDDEEPIQDLLAKALDSGQYQVIHCYDGKKAIELMKCHSVDLLITDIFMPEQDGLETISIARNLFPGLKILAITAYSSGPFLKLAKLMGCVETLAKPLDLKAVRDRVKAIVDS